MLSLSLSLSVSFSVSLTPLPLLHSVTTLLSWLAYALLTALPTPTVPSGKRPGGSWTLLASSSLDFRSQLHKSVVIFVLKGWRRLPGLTPRPYGRVFLLEELHPVTLLTLPAFALGYMIKRMTFLN